jgi:nucleotide-binding universal stress UspA family protein
VTLAASVTPEASGVLTRIKARTRGTRYAEQMKILVPIDGSDNALRALRYAVKLATRSGGSLHLVLAHEEVPHYGEIAVYVPREKLEALQRERGEAILHEAEKLLKDSGLSYTKHIAVGPPAPAIVAQGEELGCDLIVMGTRGMGALANLLMGAVATKVVHLAKLPVTLVK